MYNTTQQPLNFKWTCPIDNDGKFHLAKMPNEQSHLDGCFEHIKHMIKLMGKKIITIIR